MSKSKQSTPRTPKKAAAKKRAPRKSRVKTLPSSPKGGRPKILIDEEVTERIRSYSAVGATWDMIAIKTGIGLSTLKRSEEANHAYQSGKADAILTVGGQAFTMASSGRHPDMTKFWLKTQANWRENHGLIEINHTEGDGPTATDIINERLDALAVAAKTRIKKEDE